MFDLFRSREKMVRIFLGAILVVVSLSMLTYLVPSYGNGSGTNAVVAQIGKETITVPDVQQQIENTMRGRQIPPEVLPTFIPQIVNQMITSRVLAYEAQRLGYKVSDQDLANAIQLMLPNLFPDGKFVGKDMYAQVLAQQNLTIPQFEADLRREILATRLREVAVEGTIVTPFEIEQTYLKNNEKIKLEYVKLTPDKYKKEVEPTGAEMQSYFKANAANFQIPEKKDLTILIADQAKLEQSINPTDAQLKQIYDQNINQFRLPERVEVRHILLMTQGKPPADDAKIKAQAEDLLKQLRAGANFADLAKKYSEDPGSAAKGGDLGWIVRGQTVPEFEQVAFSLKPGEISGLVKTQYGYHIIQVLKHEDARIQPFDEVKAQLAEQVKKQQVSTMMEAISDKAQTALSKDPLHPEQVAAQFNMEVVQAKAVEPGKPVPEIGTNSDFDQSLTGLNKGQVSQPVALPGNKIALAVVDDVIPPRPATFDEVKDQIHLIMTRNRLTKAVQDHARELIDKAKSMGGDLAKAAKSMGLQVETTDEITRNSDIKGLGSAVYFQEAFLRPDGTLVGPVGVPDGTVVAKVIEHIKPDMSKLAEQRATIRDQIKSQKARDRDVLFEAGVRDRLIAEGKVKIHEDVINRLAQNYRG